MGVHDVDHFNGHSLMAASLRSRRVNSHIQFLILFSLFSFPLASFIICWPIGKREWEKIFGRVLSLTAACGTTPKLRNCMHPPNLPPYKFLYFILFIDDWWKIIMADAFTVCDTYKYTRPNLLKDIKDKEIIGRVIFIFIVTYCDTAR